MVKQQTKLSNILFPLAVIVFLLSSATARAEFYYQTIATEQVGSVGSGQSLGNIYTSFIGLAGNLQDISIFIDKGAGNLNLGLDLRECTSQNAPTATTSPTALRITSECNGSTIFSGGTSDFATNDPQLFTATTSAEITLDPEKWYLLNVYRGNSGDTSLQVMGGELSSLYATQAISCSGNVNSACSQTPVAGTMFFYINTTQSVSSTTNRIVSYTPTYNEVIGTSTEPFTVYYYLDPELYEDTDEEYQYFGVQYEYVHALSNYQEEQANNASLGHIITNTSNNGYDTFYGSITNATQQGTYNVKIELYGVKETPWYTPWADGERIIFDRKNTQFIVTSSTTPEQIQDAILEQENRLNQGEQGTLDTLKGYVTQALNTLLYMPPIGYGAHIVDLLRATTTATATIAITHTFPDDAPAGLAGVTFTLDTKDAIEQAIATIRAEEIDTIEGDPFEKFMFYWNLMWYIALVLWIMQQIFSMYEIDLTYNSKGGQYQKRGSVRGVSTANKPSNSMSMRRDQFRSYD